MNFLRKLIRTLLISAILAGLFTGNAGAMMVDRVVAKVNDEIITMSGLKERFNAEMARLYRMGVTNLPPKEEVLKQLLDRMVDEKLQIQDGKKLGVSIEEESILKALDDIKKANNINDQQLEEMLVKEMTSLEQYKETIRNQILVSKVVGFQVKNRTKISDAEVKRYYQKNKSRFRTPPQVKARHILFILDDTMTEADRKTKEDRARTTLEEIRKGASFEEMAKKYSEDVSASSGGDLGILSRGKMVIDFENAVFALKKGEVSDLVRTPYGIHIIKVDGISGGTLRPFEEVRPEIENEVAAKKYDQVYKSYMEDLRKSAFIEKSLFESPSVKEEKGNSQASINRKRSRPEKTGERTRRTRSSRRNSSPKKIHPNDILPPLTIPVSSQNGKAVLAESKEKEEVETPEIGSNGLETVQNELLRIKKLRDQNKISETEYRKRKLKLLEKLQ